MPQQEAWVVERMGRFHRILEPVRPSSARPGPAGLPVPSRHGGGGDESTSWGPALTFGLQLPRPDRPEPRLLTVKTMLPPLPVALATSVCGNLPDPLPAPPSARRKLDSAGPHSLDSPIHSEDKLLLPILLGFPTIDTPGLLLFWACPFVDSLPIPGLAWIPTPHPSEDP